MLTKKQKKAFKLTAVLALLLGCVMVVPFRTFSQEIGYTLDIVVKGIIIPIIILLLSISANVLKYKEIKATKLRSKTVNIMSYLPLIIYLAALSVSTLHTLLVSGEGHPASEVLGVFTWGLTFTVFVGILLLLIISTKLLNKMVMKLEKNGTIYLDLGVAVVALAIVIVSIVISASYNHAFNGLEFYHKGDLALLIIYVAAFIAFFKLCSYVAKVINKDELMLNANIDDIRTGNAPVHVKNAEYKAAYEKLRKEHEAYLAANKDKDLPQETDFETEILDEPVQEQEVEEKPVEAEVVEEQPVEEQPAEAPVVEEEVVEDNPTEEAK